MAAAAQQQARRAGPPNCRSLQHSTSSRHAWPDCLPACPRCGPLPHAASQEANQVACTQERTARNASPQPLTAGTLGFCCSACSAAAGSAAGAAAGAPKLKGAAGAAEAGALSAAGAAAEGAAAPKTDGRPARAGREGRQWVGLTHRVGARAAVVWAPSERCCVPLPSPPTCPPHTCVTPASALVGAELGVASGAAALAAPKRKSEVAGVEAAVVVEGAPKLNPGAAPADKRHTWGPNSACA